MENAIQTKTDFTELTAAAMSSDCTRSFRSALGKFATGVTVILTRSEAGFHGMTANAFTAVSLDPPLVLVSVSSEARTADMIRSQGHFSVNLLSQEQETVSSLFAGRGQPNEAAEVEWFDNETPYLSAAFGAFVCSVFNVVNAGDHTLFLGRVNAYRHEDQQPLLFYGGQYRKLAI